MKKWRGGDEDTESFQKMRRGARKPKRGKQEEDLFLDESRWSELPKGGFAARVVEVHKRYAFVSVEKELGKIDTRDVHLATVARKFLLMDRSSRNFVVVGDRVYCLPSTEQFANVGEDLPCCVIQAIAPRKTQISRIDPLRNDRVHVLSSNIDQLVVVASYLKPTVKWGLIDRYLVLAESQRLRSVLVLTKPDLLPEARDRFVEDAEMRVATYRKLGYTVFEIQGNASKRSEAVKALGSELGGKISILSGHSGVGKSTLVNLYNPEILQFVEPVEDINYKGRHTTSFASFIKIDRGGYVIDTPGIRSFLIEQLNAIDLSDAFVELRPFLGKCKFRECRHLDEPGCEVRVAVAAGEIAEWRYRSYLGILTGATGREGRLRDVDITVDDYSEEEEGEENTP